MKVKFIIAVCMLLSGNLLIKLQPTNQCCPPVANFVAVGTMEPYIDIWDIDLVDTMEPVVSLGRRKRKKSKKVRSHCLELIIDY